MIKRLIFNVLVFGSCCLYGNQIDGMDEVFLYLKKFQFENATLEIEKIRDEKIRFQLAGLTDILFYAGQKDSTSYKVYHDVNSNKNSVLEFIKLLNKGYFELFYHKSKSEAFKFFYNALEMSRSLRNKTLQKAALLAILEYYHQEIAQNSKDHEQYLKQYQNLRTDETDDIWTTIYGMIFYSKTLEKNLDPTYFKLATTLVEYETNQSTSSKLLPLIYFEHGLSLELEKSFKEASRYYNKAFADANDYPFLRDIRYLSMIRLSTLAQQENKYSDAFRYLKEARKNINLADTLRSNYYLNLYLSRYYKNLKNLDSAYYLLNKANTTRFYLDYQTNTLEISRLNVVLQTQQKELENTRLRQNRVLLLVALSVVAMLLLLSYLAYKNIVAKKKIVEKEREIQTQKVDALLKEQELVGIDAMIEGQEKERQRMANDLHDNLGSLLATLKLHMQHFRIKNNAVSGAGAQELDKTDELLEEAYQKVRHLAHAGNAGVNAQDGLLPNVKNFAAKVSAAYELHIKVLDHGMDERLENSLEITMFRIIQELITNIIKHSRATEATIHLTHHINFINVLVEDNGIGYDVSKEKASSGMGLYSIHKRIENLNGELTIESVKHKGTTVIIDIPMP